MQKKVWLRGGKARTVLVSEQAFQRPTVKVPVVAPETEPVDHCGRARARMYASSASAASRRCSRTSSAMLFLLV